MTCLYVFTYAEAAITEQGSLGKRARRAGRWDRSLCKKTYFLPAATRRGGGRLRRGRRSEHSKMNNAEKRGMAGDGVREPGEMQMAPSVNHHHHQQQQHDSGAGDELVSSVTLYRRRPRLLHGTVLPFLALLYPGWLYVWLGVYGASEYPEAGLLALAAIGIAHVLTALSGYWSVHAHCWLTCSKVNTRNNDVMDAL